MKILTLIFVSMFVVMTTFAANFDKATYQKFMAKPSRGIDGVAAEKWINSIQTTSIEEKLNLLKLYAWAIVNQGEVPEFSVFSSKIDEKVASFNLKLEPHKIMLVKHCYSITKYREPMLKYIETFPMKERVRFNGYAFYLEKAGRYQEAIDQYVSFYGDYGRALNCAINGLNDMKKAYNIAEEGLTKKMKASIANRVIYHICNSFVVSEQLTNEQVKSLLQRYHRKFITNLAKDKTNWEPIIVQIKLTLSSY